MDVLVLGGTHHVGRCVVEEALARGHSVTTLNRGVSGPPASGARSLHADRLDSSSVVEALGSRTWDLAVDTWSGPPLAVRDAAVGLARRAERFCYVSSISVYRWPIPPGVDETGPVVDADPSSPDSGDYAACKRGGELAALDAFGERCLVARPGLILGPYERVGRLPWWLRRLERGGRVLCPGPWNRPLQYIDGRDLAAWILSAVQDGLGGTFNTVSEPGHTVMGELLETASGVTGSRAELVWVPASAIEDAGIAPWTELPIWLPPEGEAAAMHASDVSAAVAHGLTCRPMVETVAATWSWLQAEGDPPSLSSGTIGLAKDREEAFLAGIS